MLEGELHKLLEGTADAAIVADTDGAIRYWNRAAEMLLGHSAYGVLGRPCAELIDGQDATGNQLCRPDCTVLKSCAAGRQIPNFDMEARTSAGTRLWVNVSILRWHDSYRRRHFCIHLMRDIGLRKETDELNRKLLDAAEQLVNLSGRRKHDATVSPLTNQEQRILRSLAQGRSPAETARRLKIAPRTLRNHLYNVNRKLGTRNRLAAVVHAMQHGLI